MADGSAPLAYRPALRREIEELVEELIAVLDMFDGDVDLEDGEDHEPYLGWVSTERGNQVGDCEDIEVEDENDEPELGWIALADGSVNLGGTSEGEPSLGWTGPEAAYGRYPEGWNVNQDLEEEHDGR